MIGRWVRPEGVLRGDLRSGGSTHAGSVLDVRQRPVTHDGELIADEPQGYPTFVVAKEEGRWLMVSGPAPPIADPETLAAR